MNGDNGIKGNIELPYWAKVLLYLVKDLGLPVFMILAIFGMWAGWLDSPTQKQHQDIMTRTVGNQKLLEKNNGLMNQNAESLDELIYVNRAACVNNAKGETQQARCLRGHD